MRNDNKNNNNHDNNSFRSKSLIKRHPKKQAEKRAKLAYSSPDIPPPYPLPLSEKRARPIISPKRKTCLPTLALTPEAPGNFRTRPRVAPLPSPSPLHHPLGPAPRNEKFARVSLCSQARVHPYTRATRIHRTALVFFARIYIRNVTRGRPTSSMPRREMKHRGPPRIPWLGQKMDSRKGPVSSFRRKKLFFSAAKKGGGVLRN